MSKESARPFVGRKAELAKLRAGLERAISGRGGLFLVSGEPGIGKTRICEELVASARLLGVDVCAGRCHEEEGAPAWWPWVQVLRAWLRGHGIDAARRLLGDAVADVARVLPEITEAHRSRRPPLWAPESNHDHFRLLDTVAAFLRRAADEDGLVVHLDDLHWADRPSLQLLRFVAGEMQQSRLLVLATYRDVEVVGAHPLADALTNLRRESVVDSIRLRGLPAEDAGALLTLGGQAVPAALATAILRQSEGNPFFVQELLRHLVEEETLYREENRWKTAVSAAEIRIPGTIRDVIGRRLARLSDRCRELLRAAAVIGREFDARVLAQVAAVDDEALLEALDEAVDARVVDAIPRSLGRYAFSHALIAETLRQGLRSVQRIRLHQRIGKALEDGHRGSPTQPFSELAHHFLEGASGAAAATKAFEYASRAGEQALELFAWDEAVAIYERALAILDAGGGDDRVRADLLLGLGAARLHRGERDASRQTFRAAADLARRAGDGERLARAAIGHCGVFGAAPDSTGTALLEEALTALGESQAQLRSRVMARLALVVWPVERERAVALAREAVELARQLDDAVALGWSLVTLIQTQLGLRRSAARSRMADELQAAAERTGDRDLLFWTHEARLLGWMERGADGGRLAREVVEIERLAAETGRVFFASDAAAFRAAVALLAGRHEEAEAAAARAFELGHPVRPDEAAQIFGLQMFMLRRDQGRVGELELQAKALISAEYSLAEGWRSVLAFLYAEIGRTDEARSELARIVRQGFANPDDTTWSIVVAMAAEAATLLGERAAAQATYDLLLPYSGQNVALITAYWAPVDHCLGLLCHLFGRLEDAERYFDAALDMELRMDAAPQAARTRFEHARLLLGRDAPGDRSRALRLLDQSLETARRLGMAGLEEKASALEGIGKSSPGSPGESSASAEPQASGDDRGVFRAEGDFWTIGHGGSTYRLKNLRGLALIARLLREPGRELHVLDLVSEERGAAKLEESDAGEMLDAEARTAYRRRLEELREELAEAEGFNDIGRAERARREIDALNAELSRAVGLGGRSRTARSNAERARVAVRSAVADAIRRIGALDAALGHYFSTTIRTGAFCSYTPDPRSPIDWEL